MAVEISAHERLKIMSELALELGISSDQMTRDSHLRSDLFCVNIDGTSLDINIRSFAAGIESVLNATVNEGGLVSIFQADGTVDELIEKIAEIEKAVLDYLYLNPKVSDKSSFQSLRFNVSEFREKADMKKFNRYLLCFNNKTLEKRAKKFLTFIEHD